MTKKKRMPIGNIRIYPNVQIVEVGMLRDCSVYYVKLDLKFLSQKKMNWERSKRLLNGNLLVLTSDNFRTVYFATVADRNITKLEKGKLGITWEGAQPPWNKDEEFLMIESEGFFEAYR